jgi:hypothetical protein
VKERRGVPFFLALVLFLISNTAVGVSLLSWSNVTGFFFSLTKEKIGGTSLSFFLLYTMIKISQRLFSTTRPILQQPLVLKNSRIAASVILTRGPQITRDATPFEQAYFDYQEKLDRHDSAVFPQDFYFKKGSVAERRWKEDVQSRDAAMKDPSVSLSAAIQRDSTTPASTPTATTPVQLADRITQADKDNDIKKLDRALQRHLYLIVKQHNQWQFPQTDLQANEYLHEAKTIIPKKKGTSLTNHGIFYL